MPPNLGLTEPAPLSLMALLLNLCLGAVMAVGLSWHYTRFGRTKSNRAELAQVFPLIVLTTILVISVVKSSLALSLGLVGALSIVRFRTPIKEPEELSYLFMAIAIGLGLGADQRVPTLVAFVMILTVIATMRRLPSPYRQSKHNLYLNIEVPVGGFRHDVQDANGDVAANVADATTNRVVGASTSDVEDVNIAAGLANDLDGDRLIDRNVIDSSVIDSSVIDSKAAVGSSRRLQLSTNQTLAKIHEILSLHTYLADLRRLDANKEYLQATYYINCRDSKVLITLIDRLQQALPQANISCVEQRGIPEV